MTWELTVVVKNILNKSPVGMVIYAVSQTLWINIVYLMVLSIIMIIELIAWAWRNYVLGFKGDKHGLRRMLIVKSQVLFFIIWLSITTAYLWSSEIMSEYIKPERSLHVLNVLSASMLVSELFAIAAHMRSTQEGKYYDENYVYNKMLSFITTLLKNVSFKGGK